MKRKNFPTRKEERRERAMLREAEYNKIHGTLEERRKWAKAEIKACNLPDCEEHSLGNT